MPASLAEVWSAIVNMFGAEGIFATVFKTVTDIPILLAPAFVSLAGMLIALAKRTIRIGGRKR